jgi:2-iminobutanoate/2-iminopropanoate deaminase
LQHKSINYQSKKNMKAISTNNAPAAIGPYSQAIEVNGFVYASGQLPIDPATGVFPEGGIKEQTAQSIKNAQMILEAAGTDLKHVVKTTVYLANMSDFAAMNEVYSQFFSEPFPARSAVAVKDLPKGALVEVEVLATL